jgi:hypothetical protein
VADRYIDIAYVDACLDASVRLALAQSADDINLLIEDATAEVQGLLRNSGYSLPASPIVVANVEPQIRSAVMCGVWERLAMRPRNSLDLPADWANMPYRRARDAIENGDVQLGGTQSTDNAPGGWLFTDASTKTGPGKLRGY